jgi:TPR repeat protein
MLAMIGRVVAGPFEDASTAYTRGDYATTARLLRPLAVQGHAPSQHGLGSMYARGDGFPVDFAEATKWFRLAAAQGYAPSQFALGGMHVQGNGVLQDYEQAARWYRLAAEQGYAMAQMSLGFFYTKWPWRTEELRSCTHVVQLGSVSLRFRCFCERTRRGG